MEKKYCLIYNYPQHYREAIFKKMDEALCCDFYFGDYLDWAPDIEKMDVGQLQGFKMWLKNIRFFKFFIWQKGALSVLFKGYSHIIIYGDTFYISSWFILIIAKLLMESGRYKESLDILTSINRKQISSRLLVNYFYS